MTIDPRKRFRQFLPVVVDVETAGVNPNTDALLEICAIPITHAGDKGWHRQPEFHAHVQPCEGTRLCQDSLEFNGIDPHHPFRFAQPEQEVLSRWFSGLDKLIKQSNYQRAVLVAHNAWFDLLFINQAAARHGLNLPFHQFTCFDTATLAGLAYGETVLAKACVKAGLSFNTEEAHSAIYDAQKTADLFCKIVNEFDRTKRG